MMPSAMHMPTAVATEMSAAVMAAAMSATMAAAMSTPMATTMPALRQRRARQHAGKCQRRNPDDRSHHRTLRAKPCH